jgi:TOMM system kinase/cyclase fusion protein
VDFVAVVDQAIALLRQRGRLTYRTLQRQFQLDDAALDDLKDELIYGQRLAVDEEGKVLVWTGGTSSAPTTASPIPSPATPDVSPTQGEAAPIAPPTPEAERRQLTVMFCDLVDSTTLSGQLDPEEYRDVVRAYQRVCTDVIQRYDGHIAQLLGDGLLVYFGYPLAHEDDAHRAVRTGLGILNAMRDLNQSLQHAPGIQLALRMGIHTGLVVVGAMGSTGRQEHLALGETPNIAARMQGLAVPNTLMISTDTYRLIQGYFECQALGVQTLRGVADPLHVYRVLQDSGARGRLDVAVTRGLTPLVGRESEVALLLERWEHAKVGQGQVVLLTGDAGLGKSRLVQTLKDHVANEPHLRWECRSAEYAQNTVLFPLVDLFQRLLRFEASEPPDAKVDKLEHALSQYRLPIEASVPLLAPLLSLTLPEHRYPPLNLSPQRQRQKTLEAIVAILLELAERQPLLFILEDLHWTDPTTLELLYLLLDQTPSAPLLTVLTCRPTFQPSWSHRSYLTEITVNRLARHQIERMIERITDEKRLPPEVRHLLVQRTDGVPLFVEEMTKAILESGSLKSVDDHYELTGSLSTFAIPATLQDSLMARLDRLVTAKGIAQLAAVIGRQFSYELFQAVSQLDEVTLQRELGRLVEAEIVYQRGLPPQSTYMFKHALIRDSAYESLLKSTRQHSHQRIAQVLEAQFPETAAAAPELLAHHYTEAGLIAQAIPYWLRAGQHAVQRSANVEAINHLTKGLAVLTTLPETPGRAQQELDFQTTLSVALIATKGWGAPDVEKAQARAHELCQQMEETPQLFAVLWGLCGFYVTRGALPTARALEDQLLELVQRLHDPVLLPPTYFMVGGTLLFLGELTAARTCLEQGIALYDPQRHHAYAVMSGVDPGVVCLCHAAFTLWLLGYPDQALQRSHETLALARELEHPYSLAFGLIWVAMLHQVRGEGAATQELAETLITLCTEQGVPYWLAGGRVLQGWVLAERGQVEDGMTQMCQGLAAWHATGAEIILPYHLSLLAETHGRRGQAAEGLRVLTEALSLMQHHEEHWWEAELHRLRGALLLGQEGAKQKAVEVEQCFQQALDTTRRQEAKSLELRAAMSLSRLWQQQGKRTEAYELLAPIYGWFTEGFDTADLQEAKALLDELEG